LPCKPHTGNARWTIFPTSTIFTARKGEEAVDREALLAVLTDFLKANNLKVDWRASKRAQ